MMNDNKKLFEFAEKLNDEIIELMDRYDPNMSSIVTNDILSDIKIRLDVLTPIKDIQFKEQQIAAAQKLTQGDFMKNFSMKDLVGMLKGMNNGQ